MEKNWSVVVPILFHSEFGEVLEEVTSFFKVVCGGEVWNEGGYSVLVVLVHCIGGDLVLRALKFIDVGRIEITFDFNDRKSTHCRRV